MNIYGLKEINAQRFLTITISESDACYVKENLFPIMMDYPLKDVEYYCIGQFDPDLGIIKPCSPRLCSWEAYKFPTTQADREHFLTLEQIEQAAQQKKHEFLVKKLDEIKGYEKLLAEVKGKLSAEEKAEKKDRSKIRNLKQSIKELSLTISELKKIGA